MKIDCDFKKWGDRQHYRFDLELLGTDEHGTWLAARPPVAVTAGPRGPFEMTHPFVTLVPRDAWWIATFYAEPFGPSDVDVYVDITTPSAWSSDTRVSAIDLDLDVVRFRDGRVIVEDEDEFDEHIASYGYPRDVIDTARETAEEILEAVTERREPFDEAARVWLAKL